MSNNNHGIPPLAPDDKPFDYDEDGDPSKPISSSRWWIAVAIIVTIALIAALATPLFRLW